MYLLKKTIIKFFVIFWRIHISIDESHFIETSLNFNWLLHFWATCKDFEKWLTTTTTMTRLFIFKLQSKNYRSGRVEADWTKNWENEKITFFTFCLIPSISLSFFLFTSLSHFLNSHALCVSMTAASDKRGTRTLSFPSLSTLVYFCASVCVSVCVITNISCD
jgi:hypothetical protein